MKIAEQSKSDIVRAYIKGRPTATATEVVKGVKREHGVKVSLALVSLIKRGSKSTAPAASSNGTNKAEQIRQVAKSLGGKVRPRDIVAKLGDQGVTVSAAQVSGVLAAMGMKRRRRGRRPAVVETVASTLTLESLLAAKKLVQQLGGVEAAKTAVDALAKLG
jgi:hypothetical protein